MTSIARFLPVSLCSVQLNFYELGFLIQQTTSGGLMVYFNLVPRAFWVFVKMAAHSTILKNSQKALGTRLECLSLHTFSGQTVTDRRMSICQRELQMLRLHENSSTWHNAKQ